jgi:hypothetical protein
MKFSPCARAPFYMSQDRIHLSNVALLQLLELRIIFITFYKEEKPLKMHPLRDAQLNVANICPFSRWPDAGGEFGHGHPLLALTHSNTLPDAPLLSAWKKDMRK